MGAKVMCADAMGADATGTEAACSAVVGTGALGSDASASGRGGCRAFSNATLSLGVLGSGALGFGFGSLASGTLSVDGLAAGTWGVPGAVSHEFVGLGVASSRGSRQCSLAGATLPARAFLMALAWVGGSGLGLGRRIVWCDGTN